MPQPPAYTRTKDFTENFGSETDHASLNAELDAASNSINDIRTNIALIQADDGKIKQDAITTDSLSTTVKDYLIDQVSGGIVQYRDQAANSAGEASASATLSQNWATKTASEVVVGQGYGAKKYAQDASTSASSSSTSAALAQNWATKTDAEVVAGQGYGAKKYANDAANSAASVQSYIDHVSDTANPHAVTKAQVGLGNVDNTSDADKPVSTAQQTALDAKVGKTGDETIAGVKTFSSSPILPTPASTDDSTKAATTAWVRDNMVGTVSQTGGIPTGAIIERGSNANGEYVKFADGTLICTKRVSIPKSNVYQVGTSSFWGSDAYGGGAYPAAFIAGTVVVSAAATVTGNPTPAAALWPTCYSGFSDTNWGNWRTVTADSTVAHAPILHLTATGRWF